MSLSVGNAMCIAIGACVLVMKVICLMAPPRATSIFWFLVSPLVATVSWNGSRPVTAVLLRQRAWHLLMVCAAMYVAVTAARWGVHTHSPSVWVAGYLAVPVTLLGGEVFGTTMQFIYAVSGRLIPAHHRSPLLGSSISNFWSRRWNRWVADWFAQVIYRPLRRQRVMAVVMTFLVSGLLHEVILTLPLMATIGHNVVGTSMLYFLVQALAVLIDSRVLRQSPIGRRVLMWVAVLVPAPLIINEAVLQALGLMP